jgi:hypothetical protein
MPDAEHRGQCRTHATWTAVASAGYVSWREAAHRKRFPERDPSNSYPPVLDDVEYPAMLFLMLVAAASGGLVGGLLPTRRLPLWLRVLVALGSLGVGLGVALPLGMFAGWSPRAAAAVAIALISPGIVWAFRREPTSADPAASDRQRSR